MQVLLRVTKLLNHNDPSISRLIECRGWRRLPPLDRVGAAYEFVRTDIRFGYNARDEIPASQVLAEGYGQCNTKSTLLMALLRALNVPCRLHGFTIDKQLQRGAIPAWAYPLTPSRILHSWVEAWVDGRWIELEGFILDQPYLSALQERFPAARAFCGYGVATTDLQQPAVAWCGQSTYIQREGIAEDFGLFDDPDAFFAARGSNLSPVKQWLFEHFVRHRMNARVDRIRGSEP
ncbi:transglutaminase family protein [Inhella crocodyli]|uniref:Transglutaminase family protein n=2 Tax=Inhella crocodyli TaxID=2499851 RepID=A0A3S2ULC3_9BURK|nr:transglutaminase family protein [Inhella crocodyli]